MSTDSALAGIEELLVGYTQTFTEIFVNEKIDYVALGHIREADLKSCARAHQQ